MMRKLTVCIAIVMVICFACNASMAAGWVVPGSNGSTIPSSGSGTGYGMNARLVENLASRSGPSTHYTGCGSYQMKGETVWAVSRAFDESGTQWVAIEFAYSGATRRVYTGADRLNLTVSQLNQLPEENMTVFIGYGTVTANVNPKWGPGSWYVTYNDRTLWKGARVAVISSENGYYMVECLHTDGNTLRCWIPTGNVRLD